MADGIAKTIIYGIVIVLAIIGLIHLIMIDIRYLFGHGRSDEKKKDEGFVGDYYPGIWPQDVVRSLRQ